MQIKIFISICVYVCICKLCRVCVWELDVPGRCAVGVFVVLRQGLSLEPGLSIPGNPPTSLCAASSRNPMPIPPQCWGYKHAAS